MKKNISDAIRGVETKEMASKYMKKHSKVSKKDKTALIESMEKEKTELLKEIMSLKQELRNVSMDAEIAKNSKSDTMEITNLDILRRLSNLEKAVFGKDSE